jgi:hypothetical protein
VKSVAASGFPGSFLLTPLQKRKKEREREKEREPKHREDGKNKS